MHHLGNLGNSFECRVMEHSEDALSSIWARQPKKEKFNANMPNRQKEPKKLSVHNDNIYKTQLTRVLHGRVAGI